MQSFEQAWADSDPPFPTLSPTPPAEPITVQETPTGVAARVLELAAVTADQLLTDAKSQAESLLTTAQARAAEIVETSRDEADQVTAALARTQQEQTAQLDRERVTTLSGLMDEKAALEAQIASLRQLESDHRGQMRHHLTEHLSLLDSTLPEPPTAIAG